MIRCTGGNTKRGQKGKDWAKKFLPEAEESSNLEK